MPVSVSDGWRSVSLVLSSFVCLRAVNVLHTSSFRSHGDVSFLSTDQNCMNATPSNHGAYGTFKRGGWVKGIGQRVLVG